MLVIAGPNGAGKTTFTQNFLPREADCPKFINADLIAAGLEPFQPEVAAVQAGRLMLADVRLAIDRVAQRVRQGGHAIPVDVIRRRFEAGRRNFDRLYKNEVDEWFLFDNSSSQTRLLDQS